MRSTRGKNVDHPPLVRRPPPVINEASSASAGNPTTENVRAPVAEESAPASVTNCMHCVLDSSSVVMCGVVDATAIRERWSDGRLISISSSDSDSDFNSDLAESAGVLYESCENAGVLYESKCGAHRVPMHR